MAEFSVIKILDRLALMPPDPAVTAIVMNPATAAAIVNRLCPGGGTLAHDASDRIMGIPVQYSDVVPVGEVWKRLI